MRAIGWAVAASVALVAAYLALGGASYAPADVAEPCATRDWRDPGGVAEVAEQIVLSTLDGAACELGVSREEIVLAFASSDSLERFAREQGIERDELEELARSGLVRAIDDAERADAIEPTTADLLRGIAGRIPISELLELLDLLGVLPGV
jgi:hypothetical protein